MTPHDNLSSTALLETISDGVYQLDRDGQIVAVNDALTILTGYERDTLLGTHVSRLLHVEEIVRVETAIRTHLLAGSRDSLRLTLAVNTATGETRPCEVRITPVMREGEFRGTVGVVRETDGRDAATPVRNERERRHAFDALAEASADGIIMLDDESVVRYVNPAVERILGYAPEELIRDSMVTIMPERLRTAHSEGLERYLETGEKRLDWTYVELPGLHRDGHEVPLALSFNEFTHGGEHYFVGTFRDISKRKEVEQELERQNERLDRFASMLAHELRNPLHVAQMYLGFVENADETTVDQIADALARIDELIEVLLVLARGRDDVGGEAVVELADAAATAWANTETETAELDVATERTIRVNPTHFQNLLENLFRNAVEHGSTSSRSQTDDAVEHSDGTVTVRVGSLEDGFYVEDTGPGIPEDERSNVVEAGYSTDDDGIGLGLTFVAQLATAYGWTFEITESDDGGARFEFTSVARS